jgi:hypothetical protein
MRHPSLSYHCLPRWHVRSLIYSLTPAVVDAPVAIAPIVVVGLLNPPPPPTVALCLQTTGVGESLKAKPPDRAALEGCLEGATFVCCRRCAQLAVKCRGGTFKLPSPRRRLPSKVVSRRRMPCPRSCSLHFLRGGTFSSLHYIADAPPHRSDVSHGFLRSTCCKVVEGAAFVCSRRCAQLAVMCRGGTFELPCPRGRLPSNVVSRRCMPCSRSCSLHFLRGGTFSSLHYIAAAPPRRSDVSHRLLRSTCCKVMEDPSGRVGCHK